VCAKEGFIPRAAALGRSLTLLLLSLLVAAAAAVVVVVVKEGLGERKRRVSSRERKEESGEPASQQVKDYIVVQNECGRVGRG
jgi:NADH:ubiquinone oxidoreductase subunit 3 (subunit A)